MSLAFAVVKFLQESSHEEEVYQEVPTKWLTKDNRYCRWPPKHAAIYIAKNANALEDWEEYRVDVECFCETLADAKKKAVQNKHQEDGGRGLRTIKETDYFSPHEEDLRERKLKIDKKSEKTPRLGKDLTFTKLLSNEFSDTEQEKPGSSDGNSIAVLEDINLDDDTNKEHCSDSDSVHETQNIESVKIVSSNVLSEDGSKLTDQILSVVPETQLERIHRKLDAILNSLAKLTVEVDDIKQRLDHLELRETQDFRDHNETLLPTFPLETLENLEKLDVLLAEPIAKQQFINFIVSIGGNDPKNYIIRVFSRIMSDGLGELCSLKGKKNNFPLQNLKMLKIIFDVVHKKTSASYQELEDHLSTWLRHCKQRRERAEKKQ